MAVAAGRAALASNAAQVNRVVLVTRDPDVTDGMATGVVVRALGLDPHTPIEFRIGGAPASLEAVIDAAPGVLVIAVDLTETGCASAAAVTCEPGRGVELTLVERFGGSLPVRVRHVGSASVTRYDDTRVERELSSAPLLSALRPEGDVYVAGLSSAEAERLGGAKATLPTTGAAASLFLLADLAEASATGRVVALDAATTAAADISVATAVAVHREARIPLTVHRRPTLPAGSVDIPFSMPAYARAFESKIGLTGARCKCGELSYPPRTLCLSCGEYDLTEPLDLPRRGEVYTTVTIHAPIPGIAGPYALAIISLDDSTVRVLAQVTDVEATDCRIGDRGRLVLRRVALREGVVDYGYAFQTNAKTEVGS